MSCMKTKSAEQESGSCPSTSSKDHQQVWDDPSERIILLIFVYISLQSGEELERKRLKADRASSHVPSDTTVFFSLSLLQNLHNVLMFLSIMKGVPVSQRMKNQSQVFLPLDCLLSDQVDHKQREPEDESSRRTRAWRLTSSTNKLSFHSFFETSLSLSLLSEVSRVETNGFFVGRKNKTGSFIWKM